MASNIENKDYHAGFIEIVDIILTNQWGKKTSLLPFFIEMNIQEDIFMPVIHGNMTLVDSVDLYSTFPIIGEEELTIKYKDYVSDVVTQKFYVYSVPNKEFANEKTSTYILEFCSEELLMSKSIRYSKSYQKMLASDIVADAFSRLKSDKKITIAKTVGLQNYISTYLSPFEVISSMTSRSISAKNEKGSFLFFENSSGFYYESIETLIQKPTIKYYIGDASIKSNVGRMFVIKNYRYESPANKLNNMLTGTHGVKIKTLDLLNRKMTEDNSYDHFGDQYKEIKRINSENPDLKTTTEKFKFKSNDSVYKIVIQHPENASTKNDVLAKRYNILTSYRNGPKIHAELPFNATLAVGDMVDITIPKSNVKQESDIIEYDKYIQGKYLVTALRKLIRQGDSVVIAEFSKDTYTKSIKENIEKERSI